MPALATTRIGERRPDAGTLASYAKVLGVSEPTMQALHRSWSPARFGLSVRPPLSDVQYAAVEFLAPTSGVPLGAAPVYTFFVTVRLTRTPMPPDRRRLQRALAVIEEECPFGPDGIFVHLAYGVPYFHRLPGGLHGEVVRSHMPRLRTDTRRYALEADAEADGVGKQDVRRRRANPTGRVEANDMLITLRSDSVERIADVTRWLVGADCRLAGRPLGYSGLNELIRVTSRRLTFTRIGLLRDVAETNRLRYAHLIRPRSCSWVSDTGPRPALPVSAEAATFTGPPADHLTTTRPGDYFDNGAVVHLLHQVVNLDQWYRRSTAEPSGKGAPQPFGDTVQGGAGLDGFGVPGHVPQPKLHLAAFAPAAGLLDTCQDPRSTKRVLALTRRQNFLVPPRRHRAFPLAEFP